MLWKLWIFSCFYDSRRFKGNHFLYQLFFSPMGWTCRGRVTVDVATWNAVTHLTSSFRTEIFNSSFFVLFQWRIYRQKLHGSRLSCSIINVRQIWICGKEYADCSPCSSVRLRKKGPTTCCVHANSRTSNVYSWNHV